MRLLALAGPREQRLSHVPCLSFFRVVLITCISHRLCLTLIATEFHMEDLTLPCALKAEGMGSTDITPAQLRAGAASWPVQQQPAPAPHILETASRLHCSDLSPFPSLLL